MKSSRQVDQQQARLAPAVPALACLVVAIVVVVVSLKAMGQNLLR